MLSPKRVKEPAEGSGIRNWSPSRMSMEAGCKSSPSKGSTLRRPDFSSSRNALLPKTISGLFLVEASLEQEVNSFRDLLGLRTFGQELHFASRLRGQEHHAHDALAVGAHAVLGQGDLAVELGGCLHDHG